jgi:thiamine-monophosphate kinase
MNKREKSQEESTRMGLGSGRKGNKGLNRRGSGAGEPARPGSGKRRPTRTSLGSRGKGDKGLSRRGSGSGELTAGASDPEGVKRSSDRGGISLASLGEFGLIDDLVKQLGNEAADVLLPVGDDAALWKPDGPVLATTDALLEGVHFRVEWGEAEDLGFKAISVNVSDVAAMGGKPELALVALGVPQETDPLWLEGLYRGMAESCRRYGMKVGGGDTFISERVTVVLTVLGTAPEGGAVTRAGARAGDLLFVTGVLGDAAAGVTYLKARQLEGRLKGKTRRADRGAASESMAPALTRFLRPVARLEEGRAAASAGASAMIDISDGLAADLLHVASASNVGVRLRRSTIPVGSGAKAAESLLGILPERLALSGGEDYELLIAIGPDGADDLVNAMKPTGTILTAVGEVLPVGEGCFLEDGDKRAGLEEIGGFDHFRKD